MCGTWNGSAWLNVPGGQITGNNHVWRKLTFAGINTTKIRVVVNKALDGYSRIVEIEAYTSSVVPAPRHPYPGSDVKPCSNTNFRYTNCWRTIRCGFS